MSYFRTFTLILNGTLHPRPPRIPSLPSQNRGINGPSHTFFFSHCKKVGIHREPRKKSKDENTEKQNKTQSKRNEGKEEELQPWRSFWASFSNYRLQHLNAQSIKVQVFLQSVLSTSATSFKMICSCFSEKGLWYPWLMGARQ